MKVRVTAILVLLGVPFCFFMMMMEAGKGSEFTETLSSVVLAPALVLPFLSLWAIRTRFKAHRFRALLSFDFIVSAIPIAIIVLACARACFVRYPGYIFKSDANKISVGMTMEEVIQTIGSYKTATGTSGENWETLGYYVQRPIGFDQREFHVRLTNGKVVSAEFRNR